METEELYRSDLGGSLWVKNVQALASKGLKEVPPRYLRPASELGKVCKTESLEIPNSIEGYGQAFVLSEDQKLDWKDMLLFVQPIKTVPRAFIINVGDVIEMMSNGQYKSIEHRAVVNPEKECLSIAAFHSPNIEASIGPFPDLAGKNGALYKTTNHEDYMRLVVASKLDGKSLLDQFRLSDI